MPFLHRTDQPHLFYRDRGQGRPILFCSAWACSGALLEYQMIHLLERGFRDVLAVYRYAATQLSPADRATVSDDLGQASDQGADGFDQAFGLLDPPRAAGAEAKQGWMSDGSLFLHTTGTPTAGSPWIVAVLSEQPGSGSWDDARGVVNAATAALTRALPSTAP